MEASSDILMTEWNGYNFKLIKKSDYPAVLSHLKENFYQDEPMHEILGITPQRIADVEIKITSILNLDHGSFYASPVNQPEKIAAVLILWYHEKGFALPKFEEQSPLTALIRKTTLPLHERYNIHEQRGLDIYPDIYDISTDREHRGKGLATEMYRRAIGKARYQGHKLISSSFSNSLSRKIGEKLGFKPVSRIDFNEIKNDDGSLVYGHAGEEHFIVQTVLEL